MDNRPGIIVGEVFRDSDAIRERAARLASALVDAGVKPGDAIAVIAKNDFVSVEATLACTKIDAFMVPVNWHWAAPEVAYVLRDAGVRVVLAHDEYVPMALSIAPEGCKVVAVKPSWDPVRRAPGGCEDYDAWIERFPPSAAQGTGRESSMIYTSGTTGKPKAVRRMPASPEESKSRAAMLKHVYEGYPSTRGLTTGPLYHLFSTAVTMNAFNNGGSACIMRRFDPEEALALIEKHRLTHAYMVPTMFVRMLRLPAEVRKRYDLSSLVYVHHGAAPCAPEIKRAMIDWLGPILWENYGSSETGLITVCSSEDWLRKPGTVGKAVLRGEVRIYGADGKRLGPNEIGDIYLKMHGSPDFTYHGNEEARAKVGRDGFVTAGDIGYLDEDGFLFLCDRKSDMLISGGVNVYPKEIEDALMAHPEIADAAVFGVPDEEFGELPAAHVQLMPGSSITVESLRQFLRERLAGYKLPRTIVFEAELPRQDNGKIYKRLLRDRYWEGRAKRI